MFAEFFHSTIMMANTSDVTILVIHIGILPPRGLDIICNVILRAADGSIDLIGQFIDGLLSVVSIDAIIFRWW